MIVWLYVNHPWKHDSKANHGELRMTCTSNNIYKLAVEHSMFCRSVLLNYTAWPLRKCNSENLKILKT